MPFLFFTLDGKLLGRATADAATFGQDLAIAQKKSVVIVTVDTKSGGSAFWQISPKGRKTRVRADVRQKVGRATVEAIKEPSWEEKGST